MNQEQEPIEEQGQPPEVLQPVQVLEVTVAAPEPTINVPPGHVYIVALNEDGTEKENSGFFYPERSYRRIYGNEAKYAIKKKVQ